MSTLKSIPVELVGHALSKNMMRELRLLVVLKQRCDGHFSEDRLDEMFQASGLKTRATFMKQLSSLQRLRWVYRSSATGNYNVVSFRRICSAIGVMRGGKAGLNPSILFDTLKKFRAFLFACYVVNKVKKVKHYFTRVASEDVLNRSEAFLSTDPYRKRRFGISMDKIRSVLGYTRQYMNRMKKDAEKFGFIKCFPIWTFVDSNGTRRVFGKRAERLCDEIISMVDVKIGTGVVKSVAVKRSFQRPAFCIKRYQQLKGRGR